MQPSTRRRIIVRVVLGASRRRGHAQPAELAASAVGVVVRTAEHPPRVCTPACRHDSPAPALCVPDQRPRHACSGVCPAPSSQPPSRAAQLVDICQPTVVQSDSRRCAAYRQKLATATPSPGKPSVGVPSMADQDDAMQRWFTLGASRVGAADGRLAASRRPRALSRSQQ